MESPAAKGTAAQAAPGFAAKIGDFRIVAFCDISGQNIGFTLNHAYGMFRTTLFTVPATHASAFIYLYVDCSAFSLHLNRVYGADI